MNQEITKEQLEQLGIAENSIEIYFQVECAVVDDEDIFGNIYESHLYMVLSRYCSKTGYAFPSLEELCKKCYCSKPTIIKTLNKLIEKRLITKVMRYDSEKKEYSSNLYALENIKKYR